MDPGPVQKCLKEIGLHANMSAGHNVIYDRHSRKKL